MTKIAVACALCEGMPVFSSRGTANIPPPPPNTLFAIPTAQPQMPSFQIFPLDFSIKLLNRARGKICYIQNKKSCAHGLFPFTRYFA